MEAKRRKRDVLADERALFDFFDARIPDNVTGAKSFERWLAELGAADRELLYLGHDVLMREDAGAAPGELFPDHLEFGGRRFDLSYHFEPGHEEDGVTITVPLELLNTLDAGRLQWLVPGLLRDKLIALIRQLPKPLRRSLTPVPSFADALLDAIRGQENKSLAVACVAELKRMSGLEIPFTEFEEKRIENHLRFRLRVEGPGGELLAVDRDLEALQERLGEKAQKKFMQRQGADYNRDGEVDWTFESLETRVTTGSGMTAYPALVDQDNSVGLRLFDTWGEAVISHGDGIVRLLRFQLADKLKYLARHHGLSPAALLAWSSIGSTEDLLEDLVQRSLVDSVGDPGDIRDEAAFRERVIAVRNSIGSKQQRQAALLNEALKLYAEVAPQVYGKMESARPEIFVDISGQLEDMFYPGFLSDLFPGRLQHYPRYLKAIRERLAQLAQDPRRDAQRMAQIEPWWHRYLEALEQGNPYDESLDAYRWLIEEYRVSLFAQKLRTAEKVSEKRLAEAWKRTGC